MADLTFRALDEAIVARIEAQTNLGEANTALDLSRSPNSIKGQAFSISIDEANRGILRDNPRAAVLSTLIVEHATLINVHEQAASRRNCLDDADAVIRALHSQTWATGIAAGLRFRWLNGPIIREQAEHLVSTLRFEVQFTYALES